VKDGPIAFGLFLVFYAVGVAGHLVEATRPLMLGITPFFLPAMGALALSRYPAAGAGRPFWGWAAATLFATWLVEVVGVHTGIVFGDYVYGRGLGIPLLGVPPLIGFNWVLVCLGMLLWVAPAGERAGLPRGVVAAVAAALATGFDWVMEPVAMELGYWSWAGGEIPLQNYAAWFLIALAAGWSFLRFVPAETRRASRLPAYHVAAQLGFFAALRVGLISA
jgi:bisanhydrobacterioruberin hydratase